MLASDITTTITQLRTLLDEALAVAHALAEENEELHQELARLTETRQTEKPSSAED